MRRSNRFSFSYSLADIVRRVRVTNNILSPCDLEERRGPCDQGYIKSV